MEVIFRKYKWIIGLIVVIIIGCIYYDYDKKETAKYNEHLVEEYTQRLTARYDEGTRILEQRKWTRKEIDRACTCLVFREEHLYEIYPKEVCERVIAFQKEKCPYISYLYNYASSLSYEYIGQERLRLRGNSLGNQEHYLEPSLEMALHSISKIPDKYPGPFAEDIAKRKEYLKKQSEYDGLALHFMWGSGIEILKAGDVEKYMDSDKIFYPNQNNYNRN